MTTRTLYDENSTPSGPEFMGQYADRLKALLDAAAFPLSSVAGTDTVTATLDPVFDASGLVDGMQFSIIWAAANAGGVTLNINATGAVAVKDKSGSALAADALASGLITLLEYRGGSFYCLTDVLNTAGVGNYRFAFTSSGTWTKPAGINADRVAIVEAWGGGGGGGTGSGRGGGGGAAYECRHLRVGDLGATETVTIGAGGAVSTIGNATTFGAHLSAAPGKAGSGSQGGNGGGNGPSGTIGAGVGNSSGGDGGDATTLWAGAGGGDATAGDGGEAVYGGGGGGGTSGNGGESSYGGDGGADGVAGTVPGGGGGGNAAGGAGMVIVWLP